MSTESEGGRGPEREAIPPREREIRQVAHKVVEDKIAERGADLDSPTIDSDKALSVYRALSNFSEGDAPIGPSGDKIRLPDISGVTDDAGNVFDLPSKETHLAGVYGINKDGLLECSFYDKDGNVVTDSAGKRLKVHLPKDVVLDAQLLSTKRDIGDALGGDEYTLFNRFADSLPQNDTPVPPGPDSDDLVDKVAETHGMLRVADVQAFIDELPDADKDAAAIAAAMDIFKDRKLADPKEFAAIVRASGNDEAAFTDKIGVIDTDIAGWEDDIKKLTDPDGADKATKDDLQKKIDDANAKKLTYEKGAQILEDGREPDKPLGPEDKEPNAEVTERVSKEIGAQIAALKKVIDGYKVDAGGGKLVYREGLTGAERNAIRHAELMLTELALADKAVGILGPLQRAAALKHLETVYKDEFSHEPVPTGIEKMLKDTEFAEQVSDAKDAIQSVMELDDDEMKKLEEPGGWEALAQSEKYAASEDEIFKLTYGEADKTEIYQFMDDVKRSYQNIDDAKFRKRMWEFMKKDPGKRAGLLALILASVGVAIAAVPVVAVLSGAGSIKKMG